jgi:hypothetical protein
VHVVDGVPGIAVLCDRGVSLSGGRGGVGEDGRGGWNGVCATSGAAALGCWNGSMLSGAEGGGRGGGWLCCAKGGCI